MSLCAIAACVTVPALGDVFGDNDRRISRLHVTQDESSGQTDYGSLTLYDHTTARPGGGWLDATCIYKDWSKRPTITADLLVKTAQRLPAGDTETFRIRIDRGAPHGWEADTGKQDFPKDEGRPASFATSGDVPDELVRELIAELAAGKRMIAQIGDLPVVTLDLDAAKADIVEFSDACERMWRDFSSSARSAAYIAIEAIDPFTDEGTLVMELFHLTSHDGGPQPSVSVWCGTNERGHGVRVLFRPSDQFVGAVAELLDGTVLLRVDSDAVRELRLLEHNDRVVRIDLSPNDAMAFVDQLATGRAMALDFSDGPTLRFDVAKGRPVIGDFRAKCRTVLGTADSR